MNRELIDSETIIGKSLLGTNSMNAMCQVVCDCYHDSNDSAIKVIGLSNVIFAHKYIINLKLKFYQYER